MKEFALLFRMDISGEAQPSPEQMKLYMSQWMDWINEISDQGKLAEGGNHFAPEGRVLKPGNTVEEKPYIANKESVAGYIIIHAKDMNEATLIAGKCPILQGKGTSVELRETATPGTMKAAKRNTN